MREPLAGIPSCSRGTDTMIRAWWNRTMDAKRSISLLIDVAGCAAVVIGLPASPMLLAFGGNYVFVVGPILGATAGRYTRHRMAGDARAPLWAFAYGATVAALVVAMFGTAGVIRPSVLGTPGLGDAWYCLLMSGFLVGFVGALLWERDARRRRLAAVMVLVLWLTSAGYSRSPTARGRRPGRWCSWSSWAAAPCCSSRSR